jgi:hypothetical protein
MRAVGLISILLLSIVPLAVCKNGKISGIVFDEFGVPASHVSVEAMPADRGFDLSLPRTETDDHGRFVLCVNIWSKQDNARWAVYARDDEHYHPRPMGTFSGVEYLALVDISSRSPEAAVELNLGRKAGALKGNVVDALTARPLHATLKFSWVTDPQNWLSSDIDGKFRQFLPSNVGIALTVTCSGCKPWTYPGIINLGPGEELAIDIEMEAEPKSASR